MKKFHVEEKTLPATEKQFMVSAKPERTVFVVTDDAGNESWECGLRVTAEMFAACMSADRYSASRDLEMALNEYINSDRFSEEDEFISGHNEVANFLKASSNG